MGVLYKAMRETSYSLLRGRDFSLQISLPGAIPPQIAPLTPNHSRNSHYWPLTWRVGIECWNLLHILHFYSVAMQSLFISVLFPSGSSESEKGWTETDFNRSGLQQDLMWTMCRIILILIVHRGHYSHFCCTSSSFLIRCQFSRSSATALSPTEWLRTGTFYSKFPCPQRRW
jgi:hypothetical protein